VSSTCVFKGKRPRSAPCAGHATGYSAGQQRTFVSDPDCTAPDQRHFCREKIDYWWRWVKLFTLSVLFLLFAKLSTTLEQECFEIKCLVIIYAYYLKQIKQILAASPARSEIQQTQYGWCSWLGSEPSTLEIDVYVRRYALLVVLARNDDDDDYLSVLCFLLVID